MYGSDCIIAYKTEEGQEALLTGISSLEEGEMRVLELTVKGCSCNMAYVDENIYIMDRLYNDRYGLDVIEVEGVYYITYFKITEREDGPTIN